jgi:uncharacterized protein with von Willebrand factor type A (vWA) domain
MASTRLPGVDIDPDLAQGLEDLAASLGVSKKALIQRFIAAGIRNLDGQSDVYAELVATRRELDHLKASLRRVLDGDRVAA